MRAQLWMSRLFSLDHWESHIVATLVFIPKFLCHLSFFKTASGLFILPLFSGHTKVSREFQFYTRMNNINALQVMFLSDTSRFRWPLSHGVQVPFHFITWLCWDKGKWPSYYSGWIWYSRNYLGTLCIIWIRNLNQRNNSFGSWRRRRRSHWIETKGEY